MKPGIKRALTSLFNSFAYIELHIKVVDDSGKQIAYSNVTGPLGLDEQHNMWTVGKPNSDRYVYYAEFSTAANVTFDESSEAFVLTITVGGQS